MYKYDCQDKALKYKYVIAFSINDWMQAIKENWTTLNIEFW